MSSGEGIKVTIEPADALPIRYDENGQRVSPDIKAYQTDDGIWYLANGIRDRRRSPKDQL